MEKQYTSEQILADLKRRLKALGDNQSKLARELDLKPQIISMAIRGYMTPALAEKLGFEQIKNLYRRKAAK